ncbi:hypothetical protein Aca07nite_47880 [Actinoplanes capillaceus]|uniref:Uncharacterized protein n=1 Tax=Actinoplanes campanulatus TaxID=113559 RepID=A0ABQ3WMN3_9ACTN|nr:hypothetical protein [Actinoplanes capillaceus]GID47513.1 hypothetical protein Aca07nite_47880 [Actinoplanes capillaceus]
MFAEGKQIGADTAAPWGIDWDTRGFAGLTQLSTRATTANGSSTTNGFQVVVDNAAPTGLTVRFPQKDGYIGQGGALTVDADAKVQLLVNGKVVKTDTTAGYTFAVQPKKYRKKFTVRIRAYDRAGNVRYSTARTYSR